MADYLDVLLEAPPEAMADSYKGKQFTYNEMERAGASMDPIHFRFCVDPLTSLMLIRGIDGEVQRIRKNLLRQIKPIPIPKNSETFDFCLRASPMVRRGAEVYPADPETWLRARVDRMGIEIIRSYLMSSHSWCGKKPGFSIPDSRWVGELVVRDAEKLSTVLTKGIGRHKAFGFGMLQLIERE